MKSKWYKFYVFGFLVLTLAGLTTYLRKVARSEYEKTVREVGTQEEYKPSQPTHFSHKVHAGRLNIDCKSCHSQNEAKTQIIKCSSCHNQTDSLSLRR